MLENGKAACWGTCLDQVLGRNCNEEYLYSRPTEVTEILDMESISALGEQGAINRGGRTTCAIRKNQSVVCWGRNNYGQLGDGSYVPYSSQPVKVLGINEALDITTLGPQAHCALKNDATIACWGGGIGDIPDTIPDINDAVAISSGRFATCTVRSNGSVTCFNFTGTIFPESKHKTMSGNTIRYKNILNLDDAVDISVGGNFACALRQKGQVACFGEKQHRILGPNAGDPTTPWHYDESRIKIFEAFQIPDITNAISVSSGESHACVLQETGSILCWGFNNYGQLGNGDQKDLSILSSERIFETLPVKVAGMVDAVSVATGADYTCALRQNGKVTCWGRFTFTKTIYSPLPKEIDGIVDAKKIFVRDSTSCALNSNNIATCWGSNVPLWRGDIFGWGSPPSATVLGQNEVKKIEGSCAILMDNSVVCWGYDQAGGLGDGSNPTNSYSPRDVADIKGVISVSVGDNFVCAVNDEGKVFCWGANEVLAGERFGRLGTGLLREPNYPNTPVGSSIPLQVKGIEDAIAVDTSLQHACAVTHRGSVVCWGHNQHSELGNDTAPKGYNRGTYEPVEVVGLSDAKDISIGDGFSCALRLNGSIVCWGKGGYLGNSTYISDSHIPVEVAGIADAVAISSGASHACALRQTGKVVCWGSGSFGRLGNGTSENSLEPIEVVGLSDAVAISAGGTHTCAIKQNKTVTCWGSNVMGQLGVSFSDSRLEGAGLEGFPGLEWLYSTVPLEVQGL